MKTMHDLLRGFKQNLTCIFLFASLISCSEPSAKRGHTEIAKWQHGKTAAISITYDDATINQFRKALPIMDSLSFKGTFFINTADIPGSLFPPKYIGRPLSEIIREAGSTPTSENNLFERASALRFLDIKDAVPRHNNAGSLYENGKVAEALKIVDEAFQEARKKQSVREVRPVLLTGDVITWNEIKEFADRGHEFGNHTISHPRLAVLDEKNLLYELEKCKEEIAHHLGSEHTFSAECPFGTENDRVMEYAYKVHPALRNRMPEPFMKELNRWNENFPWAFDHEYIQWQRGPLTKTSVPLMKSWVDTLLAYDNIWLVLTFHGVDGIGWEPKTSEELRTYFSYMKQHEDKLWIATFQDATKYIRERMHASVKVEQENEKITIALNHSLDTALYRLPLTLKTYVEDEWQNVSVRQGTNDVTVKTQSDEQGKFILYQALPNNDMVVITNKK